MPMPERRERDGQHGRVGVVRANLRTARCAMHERHEDGRGARRAVVECQAPVPWLNGQHGEQQHHQRAPPRSSRTQFDVAARHAAPPCVGVRRSHRQSPRSLGRIVGVCRRRPPRSSARARRSVLGTLSRAHRPLPRCRRGCLRSVGWPGRVADRPRSRRLMPPACENGRPSTLAGQRRGRWPPCRCRRPDTRRVFRYGIRARPRRRRWQRAAPARARRYEPSVLRRQLLARAPRRSRSRRPR